MHTWQGLIFHNINLLYIPFLCMNLYLSSDCNGTLYPFGGEREGAVQEKGGWHLPLPLLQLMVQKHAD